jgi:hypothetical protein
MSPGWGFTSRVTPMPPGKARMSPEQSVTDQSGGNTPDCDGKFTHLTHAGSDALTPFDQAVWDVGPGRLSVRIRHG